MHPLSLRLLALPAAVFLLATTSGLSAQSVMRSALHDYRLVTVVEGMVQPWSMAFLPDGDMLITERPGRLRILRNGKLLPQPVEGVPQVFTGNSQAGLLEVALHPNFAQNRMLYLTFSKAQADKAVHHRAGPRPLRERSVDQCRAALRVGLTRPRPLRRQDRLRRERIPLPHAGRSAGAAGRRPREAPGAGPHQPPRQADPPSRRWAGAGRQPVREDARCEAGDLELRSPQCAGHRHPPVHRRCLGRRARPAGRRRAEPDSARQELWLAGHRLSA